VVVENCSLIFAATAAPWNYRQQCSYPKKLSCVYLRGHRL
jgi:hypothetical protein